MSAAGLLGPDLVTMLPWGRAAGWRSATLNSESKEPYLRLSSLPAIPFTLPITFPEGPDMCSEHLCGMPLKISEKKGRQENVQISFQKL